MKDDKHLKANTNLLDSLPQNGPTIVGTEAADRYNEGKPQWHLVSFDSLEPLVRVLEFGAKKYSPDNWKKGLPRPELLDSLMRHVVALYNGEELDKESGLPHIGHIMCNAMFYSHFQRTNNEVFNN